MQLYRFPLACAVLGVHAAGLAMNQVANQSSATAPHWLGVWVVEFLTMVCRLATPSFLLIAGFVFFREGRISAAHYQRKLRSRVYTLLVPYLAWNLTAVILLCGPSACKSWLGYPGSGSPLTVSALVTWFMGWPVFPADAPLWFVRDLFLLLLLAPILNVLPRRWLLLGIIGLTAYWLSGPVNLIPGGIPRASSAVCFAAGAWMGRHGIVPRRGAIGRKLTMLAAAIFIGACAVGASFSVSGQEHAGLRALLEKVVRVSGTLLVVCGAVNVSLPASVSEVLRRLSSGSFFMYAAHFCVLLCFSIFFKCAPPEALGIGQPLVLFMSVWLAGAVSCLASHALLSRFAPSLLSLLDGNRSASASSKAPGTAEIRTAIPTAVSSPHAPLLN